MQSSRTGSGCATPGGALGDRTRGVRLHERLARTRRLPDLRKIVPFVLAARDANRVARKGVHQIGTGEDHPVDENSAPVVSDEIERFGNVLEFPDEPREVRLLRGGKIARNRSSEPRQIERSGFAIGDVLAHAIPKRSVFRDAVDEDDGQGHWFTPAFAVSA